MKELAAKINNKMNGSRSFLIALMGGLVVFGICSLVSIGENKEKVCRNTETIKELIKTQRAETSACQTSINQLEKRIPVDLDKRLRNIELSMARIENGLDGIAERQVDAAIYTPSSCRKLPLGNISPQTIYNKP